MKVCLRRGYHTIFTDLVKYPPRGVKYFIPKIASSRGQSDITSKLKRMVWKFYAKKFSKPNVIYIPSGNSNLIHSNSGFIPTNNMPWVIDLEHVYSFSGFDTSLIWKVKEEIKYHLKSNNCKKIMPWSISGMKSIENFFGDSKIKNKMEVVYPAIKPPKIRKKKTDGMNMLFISYHFFQKGGQEVIDAFKILNKKYDVKLTMITSNIPKEIKEKNRDVVFQDYNVPQKKLYKNFFSKTDMFVCPSYMDTFGRVYQEAMCFSIPIVASNVFAIPEIVGDAGFKINCDKYSFFGKNQMMKWKSWEDFFNNVEKSKKQDVTNQIVNCVSDLIENKSLRNKMGKNGYREVSKGKFSIEKRNKQLKRIYEEAIRN